VKLSRVRHQVLKRLKGQEFAARAMGCTIGMDCRILSDIVTTEPWLISIGDRVTISTRVSFTTHDGTGWLRKDEKGRRYRYAPISVGSDVFVGTGTIIMPGVRIGDKCVVGAGSVVTRSVPDGTVVAGNPARPISTWDSLYERLGEWPSTMDMSGTTYRERVDSIAERRCTAPVMGLAARSELPEQHSRASGILFAGPNGANP
jgi:acetyltransferase-like isoleucine patch superfamily enzyme